MRNNKGQFQLGHSGGRPKGARNRLAAHVFEHMLAHWLEPAVPGGKLVKGQEALENVYREDPGLYLRIVGNVLPKEFTFETAMGDMDDDEVDALILKLRERLAEHRKAMPLPAPDVIDVRANGQHREPAS